MVKNPSTKAGDAGDKSSILVSGRSPAEGNSNARQYSCLENSMDREAWWATVDEATEKSDRTEHTCTPTYCLGIKAKSLSYLKIIFSCSSLFL